MNTLEKREEILRNIPKHLLIVIDSEHSRHNRTRWRKESAALQCIGETRNLRKTANPFYPDVLTVQDAEGLFGEEGILRQMVTDKVNFQPTRASLFELTVYVINPSLVTNDRMTWLEDTNDVLCDPMKIQEWEYKGLSLESPKLNFVTGKYPVNAEDFKKREKCLRRYYEFKHEECIPPHKLQA